MDHIEQMNSAATQLGVFFKLAKQLNELDFAASLAGEFRGCQGPGWSTAQTGAEVFEELSAFMDSSKVYQREDLRVMLMLYAQLAEAGGIFETLSNFMRAYNSEPYSMVPFKKLVRIRKAQNRIIGPNSNSMFRNLAKGAYEIGMPRLSEVFEGAFRDDLRNAVCHCDYVIVGDGINLPNRNGGIPTKISFPEFFDAVKVGLGFVNSVYKLCEYYSDQYTEPKSLIGKLSASPPCRHTISKDPHTKALRISSRSPGVETDASYRRQSRINALLAGNVLVIYSSSDGNQNDQVLTTPETFSINHITIDTHDTALLVDEIETFDLWYNGASVKNDLDQFVITPLGVVGLAEAKDLVADLADPDFALTYESPL